MNQTTRYILSTLMAVALGMIAYPASKAVAICNWTGSNGSGDVIFCTNPVDADGITTGSGDDRIRIEADTEVRSGSSGYAVDSGAGNDAVNNLGVVRATNTAIDLDSGTDIMFNSGTITSDDHAARCFPVANQICRLKNYNVIEVVGEALDIVNNGGHVLVYNSGRITSYEQEAVHLNGPGTGEIYNLGTMNTRRQSVEVYGGTAVVVNTGTMGAVDYATIDTEDGHDTVANQGTLRSSSAPCIQTGNGNDVIYAFGEMVAHNANSGGGVVDAGGGNDTIWIKGYLTETGSGYASVKAGDGNDSVVLYGGVLNRVIDGGAGTDGLFFRFSGSQAEIDAFYAAMAGKSPAGGSVTWRGVTYSWQRFEGFSFELTLE